MPLQLHLYRDLLDGWRWRLVDPRYFRIVAHSVESYTRKAEVRRAAEQLCADLRDEIEIIDTRAD